jgi:hypothetical protein
MGLVLVVVGLLLNWTDGTDLTHVPSYFFFRRLFFGDLQIWTSSIAYILDFYNNNNNNNGN